MKKQVLPLFHMGTHISGNGISAEELILSLCSREALGEFRVLGPAGRQKLSVIRRKPNPSAGGGSCQGAVLEVGQ